MSIDKKAEDRYTRVFGAYDIRGIVGEELDSATVIAIARAYGDYLCPKAPGSFLIGHDVRWSSPALAEAVSIGLRESGYRVTHIGLSSTPMVLALNRKIHRAYNRVREGNYLLHGLIGFELHGKIVGIVGTGKIGSVLARILQGFGCLLLAYDATENPECTKLGVRYVPLKDLLSQADIVSLHLPLTPATRHLINDENLSYIKPGAMLINTSRGALVDTRALIRALKKGHLGAVGLDVYEEESHIFYEDLSDEIIPDDVIMRLLTFPKALVTGHQAFFTEEAMAIIARTTIQNISDFAAGHENENTLKPENAIRTPSKGKK
jgi:phosphoglycerate dehydrogenase-like enzyme